MDTIKIFYFNAIIMFYSWVVRHGFVVLVNPVMRGCVAERGTSKFYKCSGGVGEGGGESLRQVIEVFVRD